MEQKIEDHITALTVAWANCNAFDVRSRTGRVMPGWRYKILTRQSMISYFCRVMPGLRELVREATMEGIASYKRCAQEVDRAA